jgi:hypothetical protein
MSELSAYSRKMEWIYKHRGIEASVRIIRSDRELRHTMQEVYLDLASQDLQESIFIEIGRVGEIEKLHHTNTDGRLQDS